MSKCSVCGNRIGLFGLSGYDCADETCNKIFCEPCSNTDLRQCPDCEDWFCTSCLSKDVHGCDDEDEDEEEDEEEEDEDEEDKYYVSDKYAAVSYGDGWDTTFKKLEELDKKGYIFWFVIEDMIILRRK